MKYLQVASNTESLDPTSEAPEMIDVLDRIRHLNGMTDDLLKFLEGKLDNISPEEQMPSAPMCDKSSRPEPASIMDAFRRQVEAMVTTYERLANINRRVNGLW